MTNIEIKREFIQRLFSRGIFTKQVSEQEYVTRCPYCGDSKDPSHGHFYIHIDLDRNTNMVYNCFKCPVSGVITSDVCKRLDIEDLSILSKIQVLNDTSEKIRKEEALHILKFDYKLPEEFRYPQKIQYIENRLGLSLTEEDLKKLKVVPSLYDFLIYNGIKMISGNKTWCDLLEKYYVGFLSYGNSYILFRDITGSMNIPWVKYPITKESKQSRVFYSVSTRIDRLTDDEININLCEGVMDAISVSYNLNHKEELTIAVTGKYYEPIVRHLIQLGLFGDNVRINIFADNDEKFNEKNTAGDTTIEFYQHLFRTMKYLFKSVKVFYNLKKKDCGYPREEIVLKEYKL